MDLAEEATNGELPTFQRPGAVSSATSSWHELTLRSVSRL